MSGHVYDDGCPDHYVGVFIASCGHVIPIYTAQHARARTETCSECAGLHIHWGTE